MNARAISIVAGCLLATSCATAHAGVWLPGPLDDTPGGANDDVYASVPWDPDGAGPEEEQLVVGGAFTSIQGVAANRIAVRVPSTGEWQPIGEGFDGNVLCLGVWNGELIAGGAFGTSGGTITGRLARWDGSAWRRLGTGVLGTSPNCMLVYDGDLIVGAVVYDGSTDASFIARWDGTRWYELGAGLDGFLYDLAEYNGELIAGGQFDSAGGQPANGIAAWNGSSWRAFGGGVQPSGTSVHSLELMNGALIAGGNFDQAGGVAAQAIARWNGSTWQAMGNITGGTYDIVKELSYRDGELVAAVSVYIAPSSWDGFFTRWNGSTWTSQGSSDQPVHTIQRIFGEWMIGGEFTQMGGRYFSHIARLGVSGWGPFGGGTVEDVSAMIPYLSRMVAAGTFQQPAPNYPANNIVGWDGLGLSSFDSGINGPVYALETFKYPGTLGSYELIAGGYFSQAGGVAANFIARWNERPNVIGDNPEWQPMGAGFNNVVRAIKRYNNQTYAAGDFLNSGTSSVAHIARWNETTDVWEPVGGGIDGPVYALEVYNGQLYAGGQFFIVGGTYTGSLARWNGTSWSGTNVTFFGTIRALEVHDNVLRIGGQFTHAGATNHTNFNGTSYFAYPTNPDNTVRALLSQGGREYVGGDFNTIGGEIISARLVARESDWREMNNGGTSENVFALAPFQNELHVGGNFPRAGGITSPGWARYSETGTPWIVRQPSSVSTSSGSDVSFTVKPAPGYAGLTYQWYRAGTPLADGPTGHATPAGHAIQSSATYSGTHSATLVIHGVQVADGGPYNVVVSSAGGPVTSSYATLTVDGTTVSVPTSMATTVFESLGPNPSGGATRVVFSLARSAEVRVRVHDVAGRAVRVMEEGRMPAGRHQATWDGRGTEGRSVGSGLFFVSLEVDGQRIATRRLVVQR